MMAVKQFNSRVILKHNTEENWLKTTGFTPQADEMVIYDVDTTHFYCRIKIGDGSALINDLPFSTKKEIESYAAPISHTHNYAGSSSAGGAAINAEKLSTARDITISGAVNGFTSFDGSKNVEIVAEFSDDITISGTITANKIVGAVYS